LERRKCIFFICLIILGVGILEAVEFVIIIPSSKDPTEAFQTPKSYYSSVIASDNVVMELGEGVHCRYQNPQVKKLELGCRQ
jgi:hypothetical protein